MKRTHNGERDVFRDGMTYRKSSCWQRRLRRLARKHYKTLCEHYVFSPAQHVQEAKAEWAKLARNG